MDKIPKILTADEVADLLRISRRTVNNYVKGGLIRPLRMGKYLRFTEEAVLEFLSKGVERGYFDRVAPPSKKRPDPPAEVAAPSRVEPPKPQLEGIFLPDGTALADEIGALREKALRVRESDPVLSQAFLLEIEEVSALLPWRADIEKAEDEGDSIEAKRCRRTLHEMLIRQYEAAEGMEGRLGDLVRSLHGERPEGLRPKPRQRRKKN